MNTHFLNTRALSKQFVAVALTFVMAVSASAAEWGTLKGRLVYAGKADKPKEIKVNKDIEFCKEHKPVEEELVVGEKGGLGNVVVYLYVKKGKTVEIHPDLKEVSDEAVVLDNKGCRFEPHVAFVRTGQKFEISNSDEGIAHNTNAQALLRNPKFNDTVPNDKPLVKTFEGSEPYPSEFACNVHPWMKAFVVIRDNPYVAITAADGTFEIKDIPAGKHEFIFWHEAKGNMRSLKVGKTKTSRKGRAKLTIAAGKTLDLGEVKVSAKVLGK